MGARGETEQANQSPCIHGIFGVLEELAFNNLMKECKISPVQSAAKEVTLGCGYVTGRHGHVQEVGGGGVFTER